MGRSPCCDSADVKKGPWMPEEDKKLKEYIEKNGAANWRTLPKLAGLNRCGKSCRLRWINYLNPDIKRGMFSDEEDQLIIQLHSILGNKWSKIANKLPGRTDNEVKNYWNTHLRKKLLLNGIDPTTHMPRTDLNMLGIIPNIIAIASNFNNDHNLINNALEIQKLQLLQTLIQAMVTPSMDAYLDIQNMNPLTYMPSNNLVNENDFLKPVNHETYIDGGSTSLAATTKGSENYRTHEIEEQIKACESSSHNMAVPFEVWDKLTLDDFDGNDFGWGDVNLE